MGHLDLLRESRKRVWACLPRACQDNCPPDPQQSPHDSFGFRALKCVNRSLPFAGDLDEFCRVSQANSRSEPRACLPLTRCHAATLCCTNHHRPTRTPEQGGGGVRSWLGVPCRNVAWHFPVVLVFILFLWLSGAPLAPLAPRPMATPSFSVDTPGNITISAPAEPNSTHHRFAFTDPSPGPALARKRSFSGSATSDGGAAPDLLPEPPDSATPGTTQHHQAKGDDGSAQPSVGTPSSADGAASAKKRKTARGSRGVANLTPEQLDRKRANGMGVPLPMEPLPELTLCRP